jgi:hypothetical protein
MCPASVCCCAVLTLVQLPVPSAPASACPAAGEQTQADSHESGPGASNSGSSNRGSGISGTNWTFSIIAGQVGPSAANAQDVSLHSQCCTVCHQYRNSRQRWWYTEWMALIACDSIRTAWPTGPRRLTLTSRWSSCSCSAALAASTAASLLLSSATCCWLLTRSDWATDSCTSRLAGCC